MKRIFHALLFLTAVLACRSAELSGELRAHDPSSIIKCGGTYWFFATGPGCRSKFSTNLFHWQTGPKVFEKPPEWFARTVPGWNGDVWAPDIVKVGDEYRLYYSVSTWNSKTSAIGLATSPTLDPADPKFGWTDCGIVIQSGRTNDFNTIDPAVFRERDGGMWLVFGSYWTGIKLIRLDPRTGQRLATDGQIHALAWHESIEAAHIHQRGDYYYLFLNWDSCCKGVESRYNIRIGRSKKITGPYLDREGKDMLKSGGSLFLGAEGRFIGPGHASIFAENGVEWFTYHFYDGDDRGRPKINLRPLRWENDWPVLK